MPVVRPIGGIGPVTLDCSLAIEAVLPAHIGRTSGAKSGDTQGTTSAPAPRSAPDERAGADARQDTELLAMFFGRSAEYVTVVVAGDVAIDQSAELVGASPGGPGLATGGRRPDPSEVGA